MEEVEWTPRQPRAEDLRVGLISWAGSYLTYEPYKNTVTATAKGLGRRQVTEQTCTGTLFLVATLYECVCVCLCLCVFTFSGIRGRGAVICSSVYVCVCSFLSCVCSFLCVCTMCVCGGSEAGEL